jgi:hypothetical protein
MHPCPHCHQNQYPPSSVGFTWWGGILGPKILNHVRCPSCGQCYNEKTGQPNTSAIAIYMIVVGVIVLGLMIAIAK